MNTLILLCGIPGSGKSTWAKNYKDTHPNTNIISRDEIRFSFLNNSNNIDKTKDYFLYEKKVFYEFVNQINQSLKNYEFTIADATHITEASRNKLLNKLNLKDIFIKVVLFDIWVDDCVARNKLRTGLSLIPEKVIRSMHSRLQNPTFNEKYKYNIISYVNERGNEYFIAGSK